MPNQNDWRWAFFTVDLELTNNCEQSCAFCPRDKLIRGKGFIDLKLVKKLATELAAINSRITFCGMGNPLLHPDFLEICEFCRGINGLNFGVTVQAAALNKKNRELLIEARPGFIEVSFPTIDEEIFSELVPGAHYDECMQNVMSLADERKNSRGLEIVAVQTAYEKLYPEGQISFWSARNLPCRVTCCHSRGGNLSKENLVVTKPVKVEFCGLFANHAFVTWQGKLLTCCHDLTGETAIADLGNVSLEVAGLRKLEIMNAKMPHKICQNCDEPASARPIQNRPYPESASARRRFMKNWGK